jgi:hypothetical protein
MSYAEDYYLARRDFEFRGRILACVAQQAKIFINDTRPEFWMLARDAIISIESVTDQVAILVTTQPAITADATDGDILSATQYVWPIAGQRYKVEP